MQVQEMGLEKLNTPVKDCKRVGKYEWKTHYKYPKPVEYMNNS